MHWFWRATIAVVVACIGTLLLHKLIFKAFGGFLFPAIPKLALLYWFSFTIPAAVLSLVVYTTLTRRYGPEAPDNETHCRKCGYILKGITEPRCPECGEKI
ncbi:MAG: hypothetical protein ACYTF1_20420 [Planctomycetota bacterium]|jgi:uncharacterized paraquat-inducible protein A